jgi:hypothetical protein
MPNYRRNRIPGATYFFTVNLRDRRSGLLVAQTDALREAVRAVRRRSPFHIDAWVVLPNHMHSLWTLPEGDSDFPGPTIEGVGDEAVNGGLKFDNQKIARHKWKTAILSSGRMP